MGQQKSGVAHHFSHYATLSDKDRQQLETLEGALTGVTREQVLWYEGDIVRDFCLVRRGWAYSFRDLGDGTRHILGLFLPGDVVGLHELSFKRRLSSVAMLEDGDMLTFDNRQLMNLLRQSSSLMTACFAVCSFQQALLSERLVHLSRRSARQRVAYFLFEIFCRLKHDDSDLDACFRLPLSQQQLADALGLSPVHVSRTLTAFRQEGVIRLSRGWVTLLDRQTLASEGSVVSCLQDYVMRPA